MPIFRWYIVCKVIQLDAQGNWLTEYSNPLIFYLQKDNIIEILLSNTFLLLLLFLDPSLQITFDTIFIYLGE